MDFFAGSPFLHLLLIMAVCSFHFYCRIVVRKTSSPFGAVYYGAHDFMVPVYRQPQPGDVCGFPVPVTLSFVDLTIFQSLVRQAAPRFLLLLSRQKI